MEARRAFGGRGGPALRGVPPQKREEGRCNGENGHREARAGAAAGNHPVFTKGRIDTTQYSWKVYATFQRNQK